MPRRMSCSLTVDAVLERRKTVTRRHVDTWRTLRPGDRLTLIERGMGLPKGARQVVLAEVEVVSVDVEPLWKLTDDDEYGHEECVAEGFPKMEPAEFCSFWMESHGYRPRSQNEAMGVVCRRIEWRYLDNDTPRAAADRCCDRCRSLPGDGPWCPRCGAAAAAGTPHEDAYTTDVCHRCANDGGAAPHA